MSANQPSAAVQWSTERANAEEHAAWGCSGRSPGCPGSQHSSPFVVRRSRVQHCSGTGSPLCRELCRQQRRALRLFSSRCERQQSDL